MTEVVVYGGLHEIGGNQILVSAGGKSAFLDFGTRFEHENRFFEYPWVIPFHIPDLETIGSIPRLEGLYRDDVGDSPVGAVIVSHAHADHFGYVPLLAPGVHVYSGEDTKNLIDIRHETYSSNWMYERGHLNWTTFRTGDQVDVPEGGIEVLPTHVDHSVPASYGFVVKIGNHAIGYTGDLRRHGVRTDLTEDFLAALREHKIDLLLCEGTRVGPDSSDPDEEFLRNMDAHLRSKWGSAAPQGVMIECATEGDVEEHLTKEFGRETLLLVEVSPLDVDRIRSVWRACQRTGRALVLTSRQAYMCSQAAKRTRIAELPGPRDACLLLSQKKASTRDRLKEGWPEDHEDYIKGRLKWEQQLAEEWEAGGGTVFWGPEGRGELRDSCGKYAICSPQVAGILPELAYRGEFCPLMFVLSKSEPFNEETLMSFDRIVNWLGLYGVREYLKIHVSGHASTADIRTVIEAANPDRLLPVHTRHPETFLELHDRVVTNVVPGQAIQL